MLSSRVLRHLSAAGARVGRQTCSRTATTHFGFEEVDEKEKAEKVHKVFANVADKYDLMNDAMSVGIHRLWKDYYVDRIKPQPSIKMLDVAGGTGDIAFRALRKIQSQRNASGNITVYDINQNMLDVGKKRAEDDPTLDKSKLTWVCGDAEKLPFEDNSFDLYTIAFGIRNCTHVDKVIEEAYRVLRPNGKFACLEFSQITPALQPFYDLYSFQVIPVLGQILASDYHSYKYLVESIRQFPDQTRFAEMIRDAKFSDVSYEDLSFGICSIHTGLSAAMIANRNSAVFSSIRSISTSALRRVSNPSPPPGVKELGVFTKPRQQAIYKPGQIFLHKAFAYRGIVICSFNCRVISKPKPNESYSDEMMPYYQVLVHRADWTHVKFPVDLTSYLGDGSGRGEKLLTVINGMDCVAHNELIPYLPSERHPFDHDLFVRLFEPVEATSPAGLAAVAGDRDIKYTIRRELMPNDLVNQRSWLRPQAVYHETTDGIKVTVMTFYLGTNLLAGQLRHCWRYVMRIENMTQATVTLRERLIKVFSMNQLNQTAAHGIGVGGMAPTLTPQLPVLQFSSTIDLQQLKGGQMWGKFKMEREDGSFFDANIPNVALEAHGEKSAEQSESILH